MLFMTPHDYRGNYIYPGRIVLNPCFDVGLSSRGEPVPGALSRPLDEGSRGTKINIVDDENKILDTGPTATGVLTPACPAPLHEASLSEKAARIDSAAACRA